MQRNFWYRIKALVWYSTVALRKRHGRRWLYVKIILAFFSILAAFFVIPNPILDLDWSKRTRAIVVLSLAVVALLFVIEALYQFNKRRFARLRLRHKDTIGKINERHAGEITTLGEAIEGLKSQLRIAARQKEEDNKEYWHVVEQKTTYQKAFYAEESKVASLKEEVDSLRFQLEEQNKQKLFLFVETKRGIPNPFNLWEIHQSAASLHRDSVSFQVEPDRELKSTRFLLWADFVIFFENRSSHKITIRTVKVLLLRKTSREHEKEIRFIQRMPLDVKPITTSPLTFDGWSVESMAITQHFILNCNFALSERIGRRLDQNCFLRVSVDALSHPQIDIDLDVDWKKARDKGGLVPITPRTSAQYQVRKLTE